MNPRALAHLGGAGGRVRHLASIAFAAGLVWAPGATAADPPRPIEPQAMAIVDRMAHNLEKASHFSVIGDLAWDSVQTDGQKLEFGETRRVVVRRPDRLLVETERRSGEKRGTIYDGKEIAVFDYDQKAYATVPKTGSIDAVIDYAQDDLGLRMPLAWLFSANLAQNLDGEIREASVVDVTRIGSVLCDHLALRTDTMDAQFFVAQGDAPLLRRVVLTYRNALGQPQFRADLHDWDFTTELPDSLFSPAPPAGAERIPFTAGQGKAEAGK
jgi:hypothetical protein